MVKEGKSYTAIGCDYGLNESNVHYMKKNENAIRSSETSTSSEMMNIVRNKTIVTMESALAIWDSRLTVFMVSYPNIENIDNAELSALVENATDYAQSRGMLMRTENGCDGVCQIAPFTLFPTRFPRYLFEEAENVQKAMNLLYFRVSLDYDFLIDSHSEVIKTDIFTKALVNILKDVRKKTIVNRKVLLIQRADYMCSGDEDSKQKLRQIEVNTIASSMGAHAERVMLMHRYLLINMGYKMEFLDKHMPINKPVDTIARGLYDAWSNYGMQTAKVLFVVEDQNQNQLDQRHIEYRLNEISDMQALCIRLTLTECGKRLTIGSDDSLILDENITISVVYFRAGYTPNNYMSNVEWNGRSTIELSKAVKCPCIALHLAGTKKIQQVLCEDGVVEKFLPEYPEDCKRIRDTFARLWSLGTNCGETDKLVENAVSQPEYYVLKPQLEGGYGNYYGQDIAEVLKKMDSIERSAYILMERIYPSSSLNVIVRARKAATSGKTISELGIYGYLFGEIGENGEQRILKNYNHGHILRTKAEHEDRGGIAVGAAVVDSPFLI